MHIRIYMVKSLSEESYKKLKERKIAGKSFSDAVIDLTDKKPKKSIMDLFGVIKDDKESIKIFENVIKERRKIKLRPAKF